MRLLILGGTVFLGRHLAETALERGHRVTLFHRGRHGADLFPAAERLLGDRDGGLAPLETGCWDAVVDTSGYFPRIVRAAVELLTDRVDRYAFVSSISVYERVTDGDVSEHAPVGRLEDETVEEITGATYGPLKALCEESVQAALPDRTLIVRPGLIVGPHDPSDRFTYWVERAARGGEALAPGRPGRGVQFIHAGDLAGWILDLLEARRTGVFNATGPERPLAMGDLLDACLRVTGAETRFHWVAEELLLERGVMPYSELPLWIPESSGPFTADVSRARDAGLTYRALEDTLRETLEWHRSRPPDRPLRAGLAPDRERALLDEWRRREG